jgi:hypothetical protein
MKFYRLYSGTDGKSHFEGLDSSRASQFFNATRPATGLLFRNDFAPHIVNYHRAPHRRWVITLSGSVDIGLGWVTARVRYSCPVMYSSPKIPLVRGTRRHPTIGSGHMLMLNSRHEFGLDQK